MTEENRTTSKPVRTERRFFNQDEKTSILERSNFKCAHCGKQLTVDNMTVEHIFPIAKGGDNSKFNLIALCKHCNETKSNMLYNICDYYKHIKVEYVQDYIDYLDEKMKNSVNRYKKIMPEDTRLYRMINPGMIHTVYTRHRNNMKKGMEILNKTAIIMKYELAYEAEAEEILKFLVKQSEKQNIDIRMYDDTYKIREIINYGQVYTLRMPDKTIKGVVGLYNIARHKNEMPVQLDSFAFGAEKDLVHVLSLMVIDESFGGGYRYISHHILVDLINCNVMPIAFKLDYDKSDLIIGTDKFVNIPFKFNGYDGYIQTVTPAGYREMEEYVSDYWKNRVKEFCEGEENDN